MTDVWQCDSDVMLTLTLSSKNKNKKKEITNEKRRNKIIRVQYLEFWQI